MSPSEGVVPCGGNAALHILFNPDSVIRFDTKIKVIWGKLVKHLYDDVKKEVDMYETCLLQIALKNMKSIDVRVVGSVEPPKIDISVVRVPQDSNLLILHSNY